MGRLRPAGFIRASLLTPSRPATRLAAGAQVVKPTNEAVTMVNANPCSRPEFIWRFHSLQKHCDHFAIAATEKEARSLIPDQHGVLTGRFSTSPQPNTNPWYRNITNPGIAEAH